MYRPIPTWHYLNEINNGHALTWQVARFMNPKFHSFVITVATGIFRTSGFTNFQNMASDSAPCSGLWSMAPETSYPRIHQP